MPRVLVTGGAGYVGAVLVPKLLRGGFDVTVLDLYLYGEHVLDAVKDHPGLRQVKGDLRDVDLLNQIIPGCNAVIHLACISNDPCFELDPELGKSINHDAFRPLVETSRRHGVRRFVFASSSSVYGVKEEEQVTEELPVEPLTDYSRFKAICEQELLEYGDPDFTCTILRPATVCGYSPRLRLDLTVNILTNHAVNHRRIRVFGGSQFRPNIHIDDICDAYLQMLKLPEAQVAGKIWNVGYENLTVRQIAERVRATIGDDEIEIVTEQTDDLRSYRVDSDLIGKEIGFHAQRTVDDAIRDLINAFNDGRTPDSMTDMRYYNIRTMQAIGLK
ncbi:MAG: NAD-dependent epimerase/dehydratase family protein [Pirellulaceae bacterium]